MGRVFCTAPSATAHLSPGPFLAVPRLARGLYGVLKRSLKVRLFSPLFSSCPIETLEKLLENPE